MVKLFVAGIIPGLLGGAVADGACATDYAAKNDFPVEQRFSLVTI